MALYTANVYDESRVAKDVLYAVPANSYQVEVRYVIAANRTHDPNRIHSRWKDFF